MKLTPLLNTNTTVHPWINKAFTVSANEAAIFSWQPHPCPHGYSSSDSCITLRQLWFLADVLFSQFKESAYALQRYHPSFIHLKIPKSQFAENMKKPTENIFFWFLERTQMEPIRVQLIQQLQLRLCLSLDSYIALRLRSRSIRLEWVDPMETRSSIQNGVGNQVRIPHLLWECPELSCAFLFLL